MKDQRIKCGAKGSYQIGTLDKSVTSEQPVLESLEQHEPSGQTDEPTNVDSNVSGSDYDEKVSISMMAHFYILHLNNNFFQPKLLCC